MSHLQLRVLDDEDLTSISDPSKREPLEGWVADVRRMLDAELFAITEDGDLVGTGALFGLTGEREVAFRVTRKAHKHGHAVGAVQALISREPERPVYARAAASDGRAIGVLEDAGFTEDERTDDEVRFVLTPTLDGA